MIVYGIAGTHNDVESVVFDQPFTIERGNVALQTTVEMSYNRIEYLPDPIEITEATRKSYVDTQVKAARTMTGDILLTPLWLLILRRNSMWTFPEFFPS